MPETTTETTAESFVFKGNAKEWFGIWITNLLLSIITLGIYSAWAKVRSKKYFYQNTWVADRNFDYHATGLQILIGRLIVVGALIAYTLANLLSPILGLLLLLVFVFTFPILLIRAARFHARNSSWANVRFNFDGSTGGAYKAYMLYPILTALTLYTAFPFLERAVQKYGIEGHTLGKTRFAFSASIGPFYIAFIAAAVFVIFGGFLFAGVAGAALMALSNPYASAEPDPAVISAVMSGYFLLLVMFSIGAVLYTALIRNHIFNNTTLGAEKHGFRSTITVGKFVWIALSNAIVTLVTLGLMLPWAQVRMHRYLAANTAVLPNGSLDDFSGQILSDDNAIGDAYSDIEGVDIGLAI